MRELAKLNVYASALPMPSPEKPVCSEWLKMMDYCVGKPNKDVYLVGHSLGVPAILRYLENVKAESWRSGLGLRSDREKEGI